MGGNGVSYDLHERTSYSMMFLYGCVYCTIGCFLVIKISEISSDG